MEVAQVSMSKEGTAKSEQHQSHVDGFIDHEGVQHEYTTPGQTITKEYYIKVLRGLRDAVRRKRPQLWASGDWQLHHDNAPAQSSALLQAFFGKTRQVFQPPYIPNLAPCNFWLFPKLQLPLKVRRFMSAMVTQYISSLNGISLPTDWPHGRVTSHMHSKVSSDWLPSYIKATRPFLKILKMAGYFPDRRRSSLILHNKYPF